LLSAHHPALLALVRHVRKAVLEAGSAVIVVVSTTATTGTTSRASGRRATDSLVAVLTDAVDAGVTCAIHGFVHVSEHSLISSATGTSVAH
jgi:hypothetical protein